MASVRPPAAATALESHQRLADELRGKIDDGLVESGPAPEARSVDDLRPYNTHRDWLLHLIHSFKYQTAVIVMVILDCICVIAELLIDLEITSSSGGTVAKEVLHSISIAILSCFLVEIVVKLYAYRFEYFRMPWEMFDAVVVIVSFALDVAFRSTVGPINGAGLIIILRLWRVTRILSGMVMSVRRHSEHKLELEQRARHRLERDLDESRDYCRRLEQRLQQHGLALPEPRPDGADPDGAPGGDAGDATV